MPVLGTKLHVPTPRRQLVERARLIGQFDGDSISVPRLVLVSAPAGFGKTTLLTQWLTSDGNGAVEDIAPRRVAWLSLDAADADLRQFLTDLVAAVQAPLPQVGTEAVTLMDTDRGFAAEDVLASLINDLDIYAGPLVLALDDYHVVDTPSVHEAVMFLLDHLPPRITVAMTTRADPPLSLSRLRARGELLEVRAADLRFTPEEAEQFLNEVMGLGLGADLVAALEARTEGWAAGLQLAALSARGRIHGGPTGSATTGVEKFVAAFSGSNRFVLDYLLAEVLATQPEPVRTFLLDTSILSRFTGSLCDAVTGRDDGARTLELLERANLFLIPLDDDRQWFRYHHLFADALRARLTGEAPDRVARLHRAASEWYAEHGDLAEAIDHAAAAGDVEYTADLVELALPAARKHRQSHLLAEWPRRLPDDVLRSRAPLATLMAWARLAAGDVDGVTAWLDAAQVALDRAPSRIPTTGRRSHPLGDAARDQENELRSLPPMIEVYRAAVAQARGDVDGTVSHAGKALASAAVDDHYPRAAATGFVGMAAWAAGDLDTAVDAFGQTVTSLRAAGMVADELGATVLLANVRLARGCPAEARRLYEAALAAAQSHPGPVLPTTGDLHVGLADVLVEMGDLDAASKHLEVAHGLGDRASLPENRHRWYTSVARLLVARGNLDAAADMLDRAAPLYLPGFYPDVRPIPAAQARVRIALGRLDDAEAWARDHQVVDTDPVAYLSEYDQLTLVRLLLAQHRAGQPDSNDAVDAGVGILDRVLAAAEAANRGGSVIEARWLRALAHHLRGDLGRALDDLGPALTAGVRAGYRQVFLDEGGPAEELLRTAARRPDLPGAAEADTLLDNLHRTRRAAAVVPVPASPEQLSEREVEVLRLLATDLTGPEISRQLFMSINTFRTHTRHIFTKLDVNTRRAAVARAGELGLI
jgi:LuxR family transcriptional regulator, maltose regulon positive regulatory protein